MFTMKTNSNQCLSDGAHQFLNAPGRDKALLAKQFRRLTCSEFIVVLWGLAVVVASRFPGARNWNRGCGRLELVKFRLSASHACQSVHLWRLPNR